jgi:hypothetical protein
VTRIEPTPDTRITLAGVDVTRYVDLRPRQSGKTASMYDEILRVWREFEERAEEERLVLVCHEGDRERIEAALEDARRRTFEPPRRYTLLSSPAAVKGSVMAFEARALPDWAREELTRIPERNT